MQRKKATISYLISGSTFLSYPVQLLKTPQIRPYDDFYIGICFKILGNEEVSQKS